MPNIILVLEFLVARALVDEDQFMDLGIKARRALVCASSSGLGFACAQALLQEGCAVTINGRDAIRLTAAQDELESRTGQRPNAVVANLDLEGDRETLLNAAAELDILINNNAGPPPGELVDWDHSAWTRALEANMLAPVLMIRAVVPGMRQRKFGRIVNITSAMVKSPGYPMALSTAARTGLTAFAKALSREIAADNVTINNLLPERFDTGRLHALTERLMKRRGLSLEEARREIVKPIAARRLGKAEELGAACAFLCSAQASYISGQNLQLDGGSYAGLI